MPDSAGRSVEFLRLCVYDATHALETSIELFMNKGIFLHLFLKIFVL